MSVDDYKFYVDKIRQEVPDQITETTISGFGEAFTDPTLLKKIKYAVSAGLGITVYEQEGTFNHDDTDDFDIR